MRIAGIIKSSFIDYPGKASSVIFFGGCNFSCGYCHNPEIVSCKEAVIDPNDFFAFLEKRRRFLDAVCISGGEPTLQRELPDFIERIKALGYAVKLDTNGTNPKMLQELLQKGLLDHVAMDVKAPFSRYGSVSGGVGMGETAAECVKLVRKSMRLLQQSGCAYEFRTTVCKEQLSFTDLREMAEELIAAAPSESNSVCQWYLQQFQKQDTLLDEAGYYSAYTKEEMEKMAAELQAASEGKEINLCVSVR